jgi:hypothetical protein
MNQLRKFPLPMDLLKEFPGPLPEERENVLRLSANRGRDLILSLPFCVLPIWAEGVGYLR